MLQRDPAHGGEVKGLAWATGAPVLKAEALAVTLLSNRAESHLRAADQLAMEIRRIRHQAMQRRERSAAAQEADALPEGQGEGQQGSCTALQGRYDEHICAAMADAAEALDIGMDIPESSMVKKSERRLHKAHKMMAEAQATRLGDSVEPRTAEFIAAGSLGGCADKGAVERSPHEQYPSSCL